MASKSLGFRIVKELPFYLYDIKSVSKILKNYSRRGSYAHYLNQDAKVIFSLKTWFAQFRVPNFLANLNITVLVRTSNFVTIWNYALTPQYHKPSTWSNQRTLFCRVQRILLENHSLYFVFIMHELGLQLCRVDN